MEYKVLTSDQQRQILSQRLLQAEADHFNEKLNAEEARAIEGRDPKPHEDAVIALEIKVGILEGKIQAQVDSDPEVEDTSVVEEEPK